MTTYYQKVGKRYKPVLEKEIWNSGSGETWNEGFHLVVCKPGSKSIRYNIEPDDSAFLAASFFHSEYLALFIQEAAKAEISTPAPITNEQKEAWEALKMAFDGGPFYVNYPSSIEIARKFLEKLKDIQTSQV